MKKFFNYDDSTNHTDMIEEIAKKNLIFNHYKFDLRSFARLRNAIVHNPRDKNSKPIAEPRAWDLAGYDKKKLEMLI